jgi:hypothetical protein
MIYDHIMVGQAKNLVTLGFIDFLHFLWGQSAIRNIAVGMQISLKILGNPGQQMLHFTLLLTPYTGAGR